MIFAMCAFVAELHTRFRCAPSTFYRRHGGRFVDCFPGEHFGLPVAVESLRAMRNAQPSGEAMALSAAGPLNLAGIVIPGARVSALSKQQIRLREGAFVASAQVNEKVEARLRPVAQRQTALRIVRKYW